MLHSLGAVGELVLDLAQLGIEIDVHLWRSHQLAPAD
jgi:hypothetical protein